VHRSMSLPTITFILLPRYVPRSRRLDRPPAVAPLSRSRVTHGPCGPLTFIVSFPLTPRSLSQYGTRHRVSALATTRRSFKTLSAVMPFSRSGCFRFALAAVPWCARGTQSLGAFSMIARLCVPT